MQRSRIDGQERKEAAERMQSGFLGLELKNAQPNSCFFLKFNP